MLGDAGYQTWASLQRTSQEMLWDAVGETVERDLPRMIETGRRRGLKKKGSLRLDPGFVAPGYIADVDIHVMPGGYCVELAAQDVAAGAIYDFGVYWFTMSSLGHLNDLKGRRLIGYLDQTYGDLEPKRILDLGCSVGHSTLPYCDVFPAAEVHAIDVGAPMLRYAHGRAETLGKTVHYSQQNVEQTDYPDGHFDLIVSHILLHEVSRKAMANIMRECYRLLSPRGIVAHQDVSLFQGMTPYEAFDADWDTYNNNEPCWVQMRETDPFAVMASAGFARDAVSLAWATRAAPDTYTNNPAGAATCVLSARK